MRMNGKRLSTLGLLLALVLASGPVLAAEGEAPAPTPPPASPAPEGEAKKSAGQRWKEFWGPFALYLETGVGIGSTDPIESSMTTTGGPGSVNNTELDLLSGYFAIGWTLPYGKGRYLLSVTAHSENGYDFAGASNDRRLPAAGGTEVSPVDLDWWTIHVKDGALTSEKNEFFWADQDGDGEVDTEEIIRTPDLRLSDQVVKDLENRTQTWDLLYQRDFSYGKGRITGRWSAGARYFLYEGTIPVAGYISQSQTVGEGYTDGVVHTLIPIRQDTTGIGPTGSGEVRFHFARDRFVLFLRSRLSFIVTSLKPDSGNFYVLAAGSGGSQVPATARVTDDISKSAWQVSVETGFSARLAQGLELILNAGVVSYQDAAAVPAKLNVPQDATQALIPATAVYVTRDMKFLSGTLGLSYQF